MSTNSPHSIHALVRLLKSSTDPPSAPGPPKIETARLAWSDPFFCAANKGEVIGEWMLTLLGQAKKTRYWTLLRDILTTPPPMAARPIKTWLLPLLNQIQIDIIVVELLALQSSEVLTPARAALSVLWPLAEKKISPDALAECLSAVFNVYTEWERVDDNLDWICSVVVASYRNALANVGNKKRLYTSFLTSHLSSWLRAICTNHSLGGPSKGLQDSIYAAGADTLFSLDALRQPLDTLFDALSSPISSHLLALPKLCNSFLSATHRHKAAFVVSATSVGGGKEEARKRTMEFVGRCWILVRDSANLQGDFEADKWKSIIDILRIVEKERLDKYDGELALGELRDEALEMLETIDAASENHQATRVLLSIQILDVLVQVEYHFVGSVLERVLSALINIPLPLLHPTKTTSSEFLTHVLEYHTKTRTVHAYALALLTAVVAGSASSASWTFTSQFVTSDFPLANHLPVLAHALCTSLTPTQIAPLANTALQAVEGAWRAFKNAGREEEKPAKRRKITEDANKSGYEATLMPFQAQAFSYTCRIAGAILSNLPARAYNRDEEYFLECLCCDVGKLGWTVIWDYLREETEEHDTTRSREGKKRKHAAKTGPLSVRYPHIVVSAAFRFLYDVRNRASSLLGDHDQLEEAHVGTLLSVARDEASTPELVLEIIRTLLWHVWYAHNCKAQKQSETCSIFTVALDIITARPLSESNWTGISAALTRDNLGLAVLYVLTERWIDILDALASTAILEKLISLLFVSLDLSDENARDSSDKINLGPDHVVITLRDVLLSVLRNAHFWELHNIRAVFLSSMLTLTSPFSAHHFPAIGIESSSPIIAIAPTELACNVYSLLHYAPLEYLTRSVRTELVKRAVAIDVQICTALKGTIGQRSKAKGKDKDRSDAGSRRKSHTRELDEVPTVELRKWSHRLTLVRVFLQRMGHFLGAPGHSMSFAFANHLLSPPCSPPLSEALASVTLDLVELNVVSLLHSQEQEAAASISSVISKLITVRPFSQSDSQGAWAQLVVQSSVLKLIERTTSDFNPASLPDQVKRTLKTLLETLESTLLPRVERLAESDARQLRQSFSSEQINAWSHTLSLKRWLGMSHRIAAVPFGLKLATLFILRENSVALDLGACSSVLGLLFEELWCMPDDMHRVHLDVLVGFYAVSCGDRGSDLEHTMDVHVTQASKKMSVKDFSYLLDVLEEWVGRNGLPESRRERLIHLGQIMLHDAPQGTLKVIQHFATRCLNLFSDREETRGGSSHLKLQCLEFIARHCSDRPAAVRSVDLGSIWSFLHQMLSGSSEHNTITIFPIFHHIITIVSALIRLRRDLVIHTLPHLSLILCQLMMLTRKIRSQLGAKQSKIVTDTLPSWLSASQPLSTDEGCALARLLTSLTTKTVPRMYACPPAESQKAESLAKPFAKHAIYVLVAYVDAFNDPLCIIDAEMRKNLEPGLFSLCEMVGEHSRDALMMSALDSGGKIAMKSLWREYERQRYVGKG